MANVEIYHLTFTWQDQNGKLQVIDCDETDVSKDEYVHAVVNDYIQIQFNELKSSKRILEQYAASVTVNKKQSVRMPRGRFLYMDVGRWLDGHQSFGLVCGDDAILCDYTPRGCSASLKGSSDLIKQALAIPGVSATAWKKIVGPHPDKNHLIVILPDMHVAACPPPDVPRPNPALWNKDWYGNWREDPKAYDQAKQLDFFNSLASKQAMISFLEDLRDALEGCNVTLIQLGDMYELWAGHPREFAQTDDTTPVVILNERVAGRALGGWIAEIHDMHASLFQLFDSCHNTSGWSTVFLHGNHDSYLSLPEVVDAANKEIEMSWSTEMSWGTHVNFPKTAVYLREPFKKLQGVFVEHGQRFDGPNRDGNSYGWEKTNDAFHNFGLQAVGDPGKAHDFIARSFDTTRRPTFVAGAAATWVAEQKSFGLYVQGHTHSPELKYVDVAHQRGEFQITYSGMQVDPLGDPVPVPEVSIKVTGAM